MNQDLDPESSFENDAERQTVDTKQGKFKVSQGGTDFSRGPISLNFNVFLLNLRVKFRLHQIWNQ